MTNRTQLFLSALFIFSIALNSCKKDEDDENSPQLSAREKVVSDYKNIYLAGKLNTSGWTGSTTSCNAGSVPQATRDAVIKRINYFRRLVGLNDNCTLDASLFAQEQETALMMQANAQLSHAPPTSWSCYTSAGATGAGQSNLVLGYTSPTSCIDVFINDFGAGNTAVGHRRWILHSKKNKFSVGSTTSAMALHVFASGSNTKIPGYIAYPAAGYMPQALVYARWSFGIPSANFSGATVSMTGPGGNVPLTAVSKTDNGFGDNTIVWEPSGIVTTSGSDITYTVTVDGISGAPKSSYTYKVTIIKP